MSSATCSGSAEQPANNSKDSSAEHMWSAVQPASLPCPPKPIKCQPTIPQLAASSLSATKPTHGSSSAVQPAHGSSNPSDSRAVQPAHRSKRIDALHLEGACPKIEDTEPKRIGWIDLPSQKTQKDRHGAIKNRSELTEELKRSLVFVKRQMASSNLSLAEKREGHWDKSGNMAVVKQITAGKHQQQQQQTHHQESHDNGAAMEDGSADMEHGLCLRIKSQHGNLEVGFRAVFQNAASAAARRKRQLVLDQILKKSTEAKSTICKYGAAMEHGSAAMERGLGVRTSFGNLGERQWFVLRMHELSGTPTHRCLQCINRLAWTCKQIHTWFYFTFEARKLSDNEETSSSESTSNSSRKTPPSSDADRDDERPHAMSERDEEAPSSLHRATNSQRRNQRRAISDIRAVSDAISDILANRLQAESSVDGLLL